MTGRLLLVVAHQENHTHEKLTKDRTKKGRNVRILLQVSAAIVITINQNPLFTRLLGRSPRLHNLFMLLKNSWNFVFERNRDLPGYITSDLLGCFRPPLWSLNIAGSTKAVPAEVFTAAVTMSLILRFSTRRTATRLPTFPHFGHGPGTSRR